MNKKIENKIPLVRFPEFEEEWDNIIFEDFLIFTPRPISKPKDNYLAIGIRSHFKGTFQKPNTDPTKNIMDTLYMVKENDFLVNITFAWEGALAIVPKKDEGGLVSHRFPTYTFKKEKVLNIFFKYSFFREESKHLLGIVSPGGAGRNRVMNKKDFLKLKLSFPSLPEQQKIAHFFTTLDQKLNQLQEKKTKLETYKKGMMQKIFSQELRFKDDNGKDFSDWEKLINPINIVAGNAYELKNYVKEGVILIQGVNIGTGRLIIDKPYFISKKSAKKHIRLSKGDILLGLNRPITNGQLKICRYNLEENGYLYQRAGKLDYNKEEIISSFLYQFLRSSSFLKKVKIELVGSDQPYIKSNLFKVAKLVFPKKNEQTKIANFLSKIDEKIDNVNRQIEKTKEYKKGLLQGMFV